MSRFIEGRENFLWSLGSSPEKDDSVAVYIPQACNSTLGIVCPHLACDAMILPRNDWKLFKKYASKDLTRLEKSGIQIKESSVKSLKPSLFKHFQTINNRRVYSYFASIAESLCQKLIAEHNPVIGFTIRGKTIPEEDHRRLRKLFLTRNSDPIKHFISYAKTLKSIKDDIIVREKYENNIELYYPVVNILPSELIDYIKLFLY